MSVTNFSINLKNNALIKFVYENTDKIFLLKDEQLEFMIKDTKGKLRKMNATLDFEDRYWGVAHFIDEKAIKRDNKKHLLFLLNQEKSRRFRGYKS